MTNKYIEKNDLLKRSQAEILYSHRVYKSLGGEIPTPLSHFADLQNSEIALLTIN